LCSRALRGPFSLHGHRRSRHEGGGRTRGAQIWAARVNPSRFRPVQETTNSNLPVTRRQALGFGAAALATLACAPEPASRRNAHVQEGRLSQRPRPPRDRLAAGRHALDLGGSRDGAIVMPERSDGAHPLLVMLHGAGGSAARIAGIFEPAASRGIVVVAPESR